MFPGAPQAQKLLDWRLIFWVESNVVAKHHFSRVPQIGELWQIPASNYDAKGKKVSLRILDVSYDWRGYEHENGYLDGWIVDIDIDCKLETGHPA
jgi:hypothetical protein